jgi:signal transduction histidine kinase
MQQVLNNLVGNAIQYSHRETVVAVELACSDDAVTIAVRDHGIGIAPDDLPKIFQPFGTMRSAGTAGEKSTGLGLTIARAIVEGHGGTLDVESIVGAGSVFTARLPRASTSP